MPNEAVVTSSNPSSPFLYEHVKKKKKAHYNPSRGKKTEGLARPLQEEGGKEKREKK
jgi:hypothetical protein